MSRTFSAISLLVLFMAWASAARAGAVAAGKPSQEVTLVSTGSTCGLAGLVLDTRINADGTTAPFTIPAGQVLVLDHWSWVVAGGSSGSVVGAVIKIDSAIIAWVDSAVTNGGAAPAARSSALPNIPIKSGHTLCLDTTNTGTSVQGISRAHGFLANDK